jgi:hypothetical protein
MEDQYIVKVFNDGTRYYYKNEQLHREIGPAILIPDNKKYFNDLSDSHLYKEVFAKEAAPCKIFNKKPIMPVYQANGTMCFTVMPVHYLEGQTVTEEEFHIMVLKINLEKELSQENQNESKRPKI